MAMAGGPAPPVVAGTIVMAAPAGAPPMQQGTTPIVMAAPVGAPPLQQSMPGVVQGMPGVVQGMPATGVHQAVPSVLMAPAVPRCLECQVEVPKGTEPGESFSATTPDGQQISVTVPAGTEPGSTLSVSYVPTSPAPAPTVVGTPIGMAALGMGGMPLHLSGARIPGGPLSSAALEYGVIVEGDMERQDRQYSEIGWVLYCAGWALCLCCGPVGPVFWFGVACMHWCRPQAERARYPRERAMASVALCTGALATAMVVLITLTMASHVFGKRYHRGDSYDDEGSHRHHLRGGNW